MADFDIATTGPLRMGIARGNDVWLDTRGDVVRGKATDLREATHKTTQAREEHPGVDILVDIEVVIARDARAARETLDRLVDDRAGDTLLYVGTPSGLAGLVTDIHRLGIAAGAVLVPLVEAGVLDLIREEVFPELLDTAAIPRVRESRPA
jgi:alkanesulfonate monooxygenase SsuD/methylene tetrahydromethanopterin reductase-like flavin-dependent oxidoreductase (luciferase family)